MGARVPRTKSNCARGLLISEIISGFAEYIAIVGFV